MPAYEREMYANHAYNIYERYAYKMAYRRCMPIGDTRLWEIYAYEIAIYKMHHL
jgi:hypothetical protein